MWFCYNALCERIRIFKMAVIPKTRKATAPPKPQILTKPAELFPEPQRDLVTTEPVYVYVKRLSKEMFALEGL